MSVNSVDVSKLWRWQQALESVEDFVALTEKLEVCADMMTKRRKHSLIHKPPVWNTVRPQYILNKGSV